MYDNSSQNMLPQLRKAWEIQPCKFTLCPEDFRKACCYKQKETGLYQLPDWGEVADPRFSYKQSHNVAPTDVTPVIVSGSHFQCVSERVLQPMMWGMIPPWHKGEPKSHGLTTNNCRLEGVSSSKLYSRPLSKGQRCVVVYDGFYEWKAGPTKSAQKQPYFIYVTQPDGVRIEDPSTWNCSWTSEDGWLGPKPLTLAGLFDVWKSPEGEVVYSYSVITMESDKVFGWIHHRMPAILSTEEQISAWLDCDSMKGDRALSILGAPKPGLLVWHPVSTLVNNSRNKDAQCNKPVSITEQKNEKKSASSVLMKSWLHSGACKRKDVAEEKQSEKKVNRTSAKLVNQHRSCRQASTYTFCSTRLCCFKFSMWWNLRPQHFGAPDLPASSPVGYVSLKNGAVAVCYSPYHLVPRQLSPLMSDSWS